MCVVALDVNTKQLSSTPSQIQKHYINTTCISAPSSNPIITILPFVITSDTYVYSWRDGFT